MKMTTEEAREKVLQMHGIERAFGIIGSAMTPITGLFPRAGIAQPPRTATKSCSTARGGLPCCPFPPRVRSEWSGTKRKNIPMISCAKEDCRNFFVYEDEDCSALPVFAITGLRLVV